MKPADLTIDDISVGDSRSFERTWTENDIVDFARISGNTNPLHIDPAYAKNTKFGARLIYGMHVAVVCSAFVGMYVPGKRGVCLRQDLTFKNPVFVGDTTTVVGTVASKSVSTGILRIKIQVVNTTRENSIAVEGTMTLQILK